MINIDSEIIAISLLGLPGSGKGTQAEFLVEKYEAISISIGELVRETLENHPNDNIKEEALKKYNKGIPQDDEFIKKIILQKLSKFEARNIIFDNYPFSEKQVADYLDILKNQNIHKHLLLNIKIDKSTALKRISHRVICSKCGESYIDYKARDICSRCGEKLTHRTDDSVDVVSKRVDEYLPRIANVSLLFKDTGSYIEVDGKKTPLEVREDINNKIAKWNS